VDDTSVENAEKDLNEENIESTKRRRLYLGEWSVENQEDLNEGENIGKSKASDGHRISVNESVYSKLKDKTLLKKFNVKNYIELIEALLAAAGHPTEASSLQINSRRGRKPKDWSNESPKVTLLQTKMFRKFIGNVVCAKKVGFKVCGAKLGIIGERSLGCPAMKFLLRCNRGHTTGYLLHFKHGYFTFTHNSAIFRVKSNS
jgi:hypothetical protein